MTRRTAALIWRRSGWFWSCLTVMLCTVSNDGIRPWTLGIRQPVVVFWFLSMCIVHKSGLNFNLPLLRISSTPFCKIINSTSSIGFFKKNFTVEQCSDMKSVSSLFWFMIKYKDYVINSAPGSELLPFLYSDMAGRCTISCAYITIPIWSFLTVVWEMHTLKTRIDNIHIGLLCQISNSSHYY